MVNDRSTDKSVQIIKKFPVKLVNKYRSEAKNPVAESFNFGIKQASGEYLAIIEADIVVENKWLLKLLPHFRNKQVSTVSGYIVVSPGKSWVSKLFYLMNYRQLLIARNREETVNKDVLPKSGFIVFRRTVFEKAGLFNENVRATDVMFFLKLRAQGYIQKCDMSAIAHDIREYTSKRLVKHGLRKGTAVYQTGGALAFLHQELILRYVVLSPHYILTFFRAKRSFISLLFPVYSLIRYLTTIIGYAKAWMRKEERSPEFLRKERREFEKQWMLNSFKREIKLGK